MRFAYTAETYEVHTWVILLALLKNEASTACLVLKDLGIDDLYGAWHEVLWALNVSDGLLPRAFTPALIFGPMAHRVLQGSVRFARWRSATEVGSQDVLLALAAAEVLEALFPDIDLSFDKVKTAIEKRTGDVYDLPGYDEMQADKSDDIF